MAKKKKAVVAKKTIWDNDYECFEKDPEPEPDFGDAISPEPEPDFGDVISPEPERDFGTAISPEPEPDFNTAISPEPEPDFVTAKSPVPEPDVERCIPTTPEHEHDVEASPMGNFLVKLRKLTSLTIDIYVGPAGHKFTLHHAFLTQQSKFFATHWSSLHWQRSGLKNVYLTSDWSSIAPPVHAFSMFTEHTYEYSYTPDDCPGALHKYKTNAEHAFRLHCAVYFLAERLIAEDLKSMAVKRAQEALCKLYNKDHQVNRSPHTAVSMESLAAIVREVYKFTKSRYDSSEEWHRDGVELEIGKLNTREGNAPGGEAATKVRASTMYLSEPGERPLPTRDSSAAAEDEPLDAPHEGINSFSGQKFGFGQQQSGFDLTQAPLTSTSNGSLKPPTNLLKLVRALDPLRSILCTFMRSIMPQVKSSVDMRKLYRDFPDFAEDLLDGCEQGPLLNPRSEDS